jgi:hypothetical protein
MSNRWSFGQMNLFCSSHPGGVSAYMCLSRETRAMAWRNWKDWHRAEGDGPIHDNKKFVTRYANGATVEFRV